LVIDYDFDFPILHHTDAGVGSSQINTDDSAIVVCIGAIQRGLIFCVDSANQGKRTDEDQEEVKDGGPLKSGGFGVASTSHDESVPARSTKQMIFALAREKGRGKGKEKKKSIVGRVEQGADKKMVRNTMAGRNIYGEGTKWKEARVIDTLSFSTPEPPLPQSHSLKSLGTGQRVRESRVKVKGVIFLS